jgi:hypothetical protein
MPNENNSDLLLGLGRVEGKVDSIVSALSAQTARLDRIEDHQKSFDQRVTILEAVRTTGKNWFAGIASITALALSLMGLVFELLYKR